jgi:NADPH:quinone reductase-like Zn-dependent oxidoreductase
MNTPEEVNHYFPKLWKAIETGDFKVTFSKEYPFTAEAIREAQMEQGTGKTMGKLTVKIFD